MSTSSVDSPGTARRFIWLAVAAAVATYLLIVVGGIVRVTGSGLGCPDWPLCYGKLLPPLEFEPIIEYSHRLLASITSPLILAATIWAWLRYRGYAWLKWLMTAAAGLLVVQVLLGGVTVLLETPPQIVAVHLANAELILGLLILAAVLAWRLPGGARPSYALSGSLARLGLAAAMTVLLLLVSGAFVTSSGASGSCAGWPLCDRQLWPRADLSQVHMLHRVITLVTAVAVAGFTWACWRARASRPYAFIAAVVTLGLMAAQAAIGAFNLLQGFPPALNGLHVATGSAVWGMAVLAFAMAAVQPRLEPDSLVSEAPVEPPGLVDMLLLTKPIIVALLLVTTLAGMIVGAGRWPSVSVVLLTLLGGALTAGGSSALNQYIDRDSDRAMQRTADRPLPGGRVLEAEVIAFGLLLCLAGFYLLAIFVNLLSALLALAGIIYYVLIYSIGLKRVTTHNIVIGGGAGAIPPLVGWAAATGSLSMGALLLFAVIFFWTPPHFWALALVRRKDYGRAGIPMLPVVYGERQTRREILLYTVQVVALTLLLPVAHLGGIRFLAIALALGVGLMYVAWNLWRSGGNRNAWRMYRYSSVYLALIFAALVVDTLIG